MRVALALAGGGAAGGAARRRFALGAGGAAGWGARFGRSSFFGGRFGPRDRQLMESGHEPRLASRGGVGMNNALLGRLVQRADGAANDLGGVIAAAADCLGSLLDIGADRGPSRLVARGAAD